MRRAGGRRIGGHEDLIGRETQGGILVRAAPAVGDQRIERTQEGEAQSAHLLSPISEENGEPEGGGAPSPQPSTGLPRRFIQRTAAGVAR